jgi:hypothetical protein
VSKLAFLEEGGFSLQTSAGRAKQRQYLKKSDSFICLLYTAIYLTSGMLARSKELRVL